MRYIFIEDVRYLRILSKEAGIRSYRTGDELEIVGLLEEVFNGWPKLRIKSNASDYWKWKYIDNPKGDSMILVAETDRIVGVGHSILYRLKVEKDYHDIHYIGDLGVHPSYRRLNIANNMIKTSIEERRRRGIGFSYFATSNPILIKYNLEMEGVHVFPHKIVNMVRIKDLDKQLSAMPMKHGLLLKTSYRVLETLNNAGHRLQREKSSENIDIRYIKKFDERFNGFWEKASPHYDFIVMRDAEWLNWRYCDPRTCEYQITIAEKDSEPVGYCVFTINDYNPEYPVGYIVELMTLPGETEAAIKLVEIAVNYFDDNEVNIINCLTVKGHAVNRILSKQGFLDSRMPVYVFTYVTDPQKYNKIQGFDRNRVYISYGDLDSLPVSI